MDDSDVEVTAYSAGADFGAVVAALRERHDEIVERWQRRVAEEPFHLGRMGRAVADHIPILVEAVTDSLAQDSRPDQPAYSPIDRPAVYDAAAKHATLRMSQGLSAGEVVMEIRMLRQEITRALREELSDESRTTEVLAAQLLVNDVLDAAIVMAVGTISEALEQAQSDLVAVTAHDLKTPLTSFKGYLQLAERTLRKNKVAASASENYFEHLFRDVERMALLIDQLTAAVQVGGPVNLNISDVDLRGLIEQAIMVLGDEARSRVKIVWTLKAAITCQWDAVRMQHAFQNLLSNALKYAPEGDVDVIVETDGKETVTIQVIDGGIGLSDEDREHLFARYYRSPEAIRRKIGGSGLGLYITKAMIEAHGGTLALSSPGREQGTVATMTLGRSAPNLPSRRPVSS